MHELVHHLANRRLKAQGLQQGRESGKGELGVLVGQVRRMLSIEAVRAQAECLLSSHGRDCLKGPQQQQHNFFQGRIRPTI